MALTFKTDDGYTFTYEDGEWTDGDLFFGTNPNGPEGISGPLTGKLTYPCVKELFAAAEREAREMHGVSLAEFMS